MIITPLRSLLMERHMTAEDLADIVDAPASKVRRWMRGEDTWSVDNAVKVCDAMGLDLGASIHFFMRKDEKTASLAERDVMRRHRREKV